jgi:cytochrome c oxidase subunit 4
MSDHIISKQSYLTVYAILMGLLLLTVGAAFVDLGPLNFPVSMAIAVAKAVLIVLIFMHVRYNEPLVRVFASAGFLWLAILIALVLADYFSRDWLNIPGK